MSALQSFTTGSGASNDEPAGATLIASLPFTTTQNTTSATSGSGDPVHSCTGAKDAKSVWYRIVPVFTGQLQVNTFGSDYDTVLAVYPGSSAPGAELACSDQADGTDQSAVSVQVTSGQSYLIQVSSWYGLPGGGNLKLNVSGSGTSSQSPYLVFRKNNDVWAIKPDGSGLSQITTSGNVTGVPRLANGALVYMVGTQLYRKTFPSGQTTSIPGASNILEFDVSPDGGAIVYTLAGQQGNYYNNQELYRMSTAGTNNALINWLSSEHNVGMGYGHDGMIYLMQSPVGSPMGQRVYRLPEYGTTTAVQLVNYFSQYPTQGFGNRVLYYGNTQNQNTPLALYVANADGTNRVQVPNTTTSFTSFPAAFDRQADVVYYVENGTLYRIHVDGSGKQALATNLDSSGVDYGTASAPAAATVTITSNPAGRQVMVDGVARTTPYQYSCSGGSSSISVTSPQAGASGTRYVFGSWSDGAAQSRTITCPTSNTSYMVNFTTQHYLTMNAGTGGTVSPASGWRNAASQVSISATASSGYSFTGWSGVGTGSYSGSSSSVGILMGGPITQSATFAVSSGLTAPVNLVGVTPSSGSGSKQVFRATYSSPQGYQNLKWVQMLIAVDPSGGGQPYCLLHYDVAGNGLWLYSDVAGFFQGPVAPGVTSSTLQGSHCAVNTAGSSVAKNGTVLEVNFNVTFKATATRNVYMRGMSQSQFDTGWQHRGTWTQTAAPMPTLNVTPVSGSGTNATFTLRYPDPEGFEGAPLGMTQFLVAAASNGGNQPFCFVHYDRAGNALWMYSSDVGYFLGPVRPGVASNMLNSTACSINTAGTTVQNLNGELVVGVPVTMKAPMSGTKNTYLRMLDAMMRDTGWQQKGVWTIP
jgi:hypothetical protein